MLHGAFLALAAHSRDFGANGPGPAPAPTALQLAQRDADPYIPAPVDTSALQAKLHDYLVEEILLREEPLKPQDDLFDAGFDSMSLSRVLVFVEEEFGVLIPDEEVVLDDISTLQRMADFVAGYLPNS